MKRSQLIAIIVLIVAAVAIVVLWPKPPISDEERIRRKVIQMVDAVYRKDIPGFMEGISDRFLGTTQAIGKQELKQFLAGKLVSGRWTRAHTRELNVQVSSPTEAVFDGKFVLTDAPTDQPEEIPSQGSIGNYAIDGKLEKEPDGEWRFVEGGWKQIPAGTIF